MRTLLRRFDRRGKGILWPDLGVRTDGHRTQGRRDANPEWALILGLGQGSVGREGF